MFFPLLGAEGTKGRLIDYYRTVGSGPMLTALRNRPTHLQRFPDGIDGEQIYQKRVPEKHPDYLEICRVTFPSGRTADALMPIPPPSSGPPRWAPSPAPVAGPLPGHRPHRTNFASTSTRSPEPVSPRRALVAVDILKPLLDELGLVGYPKTSGGRGVHVFLRIAADWDFVDVRHAGIALARGISKLL